MKSLSAELMSAAKSDLKATKVLLESGQTAQALFYVEQSFEKGLKSMFVHSLSRQGKSDPEISHILKHYRHNNRQTFADLFIKIIDSEMQNLSQPVSISSIQPTSDMDEETRRIVVEEGLWAMEDVENAFKLITMKRETIAMLVGQRPDLEKARGHKIDDKKFFLALPRIVAKRYALFLDTKNKVKFYFDETNELYQLDQPISPNQTHINQVVCVGVGFLLCICLSGVDRFSRYPLIQLDFDNLSILTRSEYREACQMLSEMVNAFLESIPDYQKSLEFATVPHST